MKVEILQRIYVDMKRSSRERIAKAERDGLCVACMEPLGDARVIRGCHFNCYRATLRAIQKGDVTEEQRIVDGKLLTRGGGRPRTNPVSVELSK